MSAGNVLRRPNPLRLTIYRSDGWRWTLVAGNSLKINASTESYTQRAGVDANIRTVLGLDVTGIKAGDRVMLQRIVKSGRHDGLGPSETDQRIRITVTP